MRLLKKITSVFFVCINLLSIIYAAAPAALPALNNAQMIEAINTINLNAQAFENLRVHITTPGHYHLLFTEPRHMVVNPHAPNHLPAGGAAPSYFATSNIREVNNIVSDVINFLAGLHPFAAGGALPVGFALVHNQARDSITIDYDYNAAGAPIPLPVNFVVPIIGGGLANCLGVDMHAGGIAVNRLRIVIGHPRDGIAPLVLGRTPVFRSAYPIL